MQPGALLALCTWSVRHLGEVIDKETCWAHFLEYGPILVAFYSLQEDGERQSLILREMLLLFIVFLLFQLSW